jgi:hypothetical protein
MGKRRKILMAMGLIIVVLLSAFLAVETLSVPTNHNQSLSSLPLFVGVETGWNSNITDCKALIDKVKNCTNLFVIGSPLILSNEALLNETCDYACNVGMHIIVCFSDLAHSGSDPSLSANNHYTPSSWFTAAKERYGDYLLGMYYRDEPAGRILDQNTFYAFSFTDNYKNLADQFIQSTYSVRDAANLTHALGSTVFTSDYRLYWFDYETGYDTVLAELAWNNSRALQISLTRGAAAAQNKNWGAIITWTYNQPPYLESGTQLYNDLVLSYDSGAKYLVVYDASQGFQNTTLTQEHFNALSNFWNYVQKNPDKHGILKTNTVLVLPQDYGFGFRNPNDSVWGLQQTDNWNSKLYGDVTSLLNQYNSNINIVYSDSKFQGSIYGNYSKVLYWPKDTEINNNYLVIDLNSSLGYNTIQDAISSYATYPGDTILVNPGTYPENIVITKEVALITKNRNTTIIDGFQNGTAITIATNGVNVTGFTVKNGGNFKIGTGAGILQENVENCTLDGNLVTESYGGI